MNKVDACSTLHATSKISLHKTTVPNCFANIFKSNKSIYFPLSQRFKIRNFSPIYPSIWQSDTEASCLPLNIARRVSVQGALWNTTPDSPNPRIPVGTPERASIPRPVDYRLSLTSTGAALQHSAHCAKISIKVIIAKNVKRWKIPKVSIFIYFAGFYTWCLIKQPWGVFIVKALYKSVVVISILDYTTLRVKKRERFRGLCVCKNCSITVITLKKFQLTSSALSCS